MFILTSPENPLAGDDPQVGHIHEIINTMTGDAPVESLLPAQPIAETWSPPPELEHLPERNYEVEELLRHHIDMKGGRITYADFMQLCLHSERGYYAAGLVDIGHDRDFVTAPELHPAFGASVATEVNRLWHWMGKPEKITFLEEGAGNGALAQTFLAKVRRSYPELGEALDYVILEKSEALLERQRAALADEPVRIIHGDALDPPDEVTELLANTVAIVGTNEMVDTLEVERLISRNGQRKQKYVTYNDAGEFIEIEGDLAPEVNHPFYTDRMREGVEVTASPAMFRWQEGLGRLMRHGCVLTIDYAAQDPELVPDTYRPRVYSSQLRDGADGVISADADYAYMRPGSFDITTFVDFDQLKAMGEQAGLEVIYDLPQKDFLVDRGFNEEAAAMRRTERDPHAATLLDIGAATIRLNHNFRVILQYKKPA